MNINKDKVNEITLALLYLTTHKDKYGLRAWKSHSWDVLDRLHERGCIDEGEVGGAHGRRRVVAVPVDVLNLPKAARNSWWFQIEAPRKADPHLPLARSEKEHFHRCPAPPPGRPRH